MNSLPLKWASPLDNGVSRSPPQREERRRDEEKPMSCARECLEALLPSRRDTLDHAGRIDAMRTKMMEKTGWRSRRGGKGFSESESCS
jgi:hypothetical protein